MAKQSFSEALDSADCMMIIRPDGREIPGFYCDPKLDRDTLHDGWFAYDIRHDDNGLGIFVELCHNYVLVNNAGTFFTQTPIPELSEPDSFIEFEIDPEEVKMLSEENGEIPKQENSENLWGYSFI